MSIYATLISGLDSLLFNCFSRFQTGITTRTNGVNRTLRHERLPTELNSGGNRPLLTRPSRDLQPFVHHTFSGTIRIKFGVDFFDPGWYGDQLERTNRKSIGEF